MLADCFPKSISVRRQHDWRANIPGRLGRRPDQLRRYKRGARTCKVAPFDDRCNEIATKELGPRKSAISRLRTRCSRNTPSSKRFRSRACRFGYSPKTRTTKSRKRRRQDLLEAHWDTRTGKDTRPISPLLRRRFHRSRRRAHWLPERNRRIRRARDREPLAQEPSASAKVEPSATVDWQLQLWPQLQCPSSCK